MASSGSPSSQKTNAATVSPNARRERPDPAVELAEQTVGQSVARGATVPPQGLDGCGDSAVAFGPIAPPTSARAG